jgi:CheY-like chemotaxis protein
MNSSKQPLVLLADDDPDYLFQIRFALEKSGYRVRECDSEKSAMEFLNSECPDAAIFDLMMDRDDSGFILAYHAKKLYPRLPVILLTAVAAETGSDFNPVTEESKTWIKADLYIEKGLHPDQLALLLNNLVNS